MAFKAVVVAALSSVVLVGCGGGSGSGSSNSEYSLSDYEGRDVNLDSYAGTWVAVGTGSYTYSEESFSDNETLAAKEYFVVTGSPQAGYEKASCSGDYLEIVTVSGDQISFGLFEGTLAENGVITGEYVDDSSYQGDTDITRLKMTMMKISDSTSSIGSLMVNEGNGNITTSDINCYQQVNGKGSYNNPEDGNTKYTSEYYYSNAVEIFSYTDSEKNIGIDLYDARVYLQNYLNDSVSFDVTSRSTLSETIDFNGSNDSTSVVGSISIQLPAQ